MKKEVRPIPAIGTCDVCKKEYVSLFRTYFHYDLKCECHSPNHFELFDHCQSCEPKEPKTINVTLKTENL